MKKIQYIYVPIYDLNIWYFKDWSRDEMKNYLIKKYNFKNFSEADNVGGSVVCLPLWIKKGDEEAYKSMVYCLYLPNEKDIGIVAHELFHIVSRALRHRIGIELTDDSEEAYCYLLTYLCDKVKEQKS